MGKAPEVRRGVGRAGLDETGTADGPAVEPSPLTPRVPDSAGRLSRWGARPLLLAVDVVVLTAAVIIAGPGWFGVLQVLSTVMLLALRGLYRPRLTLSVLDDLPALAGRALMGSWLAVAAAAVAESPDATRRLVWSALLAVPFLLVGRALTYGAVAVTRNRGLVHHRTLVVGAGSIGGKLVSSLLERREYGLLPVGFVDSDPLLRKADRPVPLLGGQEDLARIIVDHDVHVVILAFGTYPEASIVDVVRTCDRLDCEMFFVPRLFELHSTTDDMDHVWGIPLVRLRRPAVRAAMWGLKRVMDRVLAACALVVLSPLMAAIAIAVRLETGPGVLFRQTRVGLDGRTFELLKFRSLKPQGAVESDTTWNIANDDRIGRVGRLIRRTSMDELPQLWNVVRGEMSLVGPRPERPHFVAEFASHLPRYTSRHRVPAGLTGWAQVHGLRGDTSIDDRARFDNYYIENWSIWGDVKIIVRTVTSTVRGS